jgi:hypothetical protein
LGVVDDARRFDHLGDLGTLHRLDDYAVSSRKLESRGIKMIGLGPFMERDPYNIGH